MWANRHEPNSCYDIVMNKGHLQNIGQLIDPTDFSNLIIYGPKGTGKKFLVKLLLNEKLCFNMFDFTPETFVASNESKSTCTILQNNSNIHISLYLEKYGSIDKYIISDYLKKKIETMSILEDGSLTYKLVILYNLECLTKVAQDILRKLMETYYRSSRFIFTTNNLNVIIPSFRSRCFTYRLGHVTYDDLFNYMQTIMKRYDMELSNNEIEHIINLHDKNIESCINHLQYIYTIKEKRLNTPIHSCYSDIINHIKNKSAFKKIRDLLYNLLTNNIDNTEIIKGIYKETLKHCNENMKNTLTHLASKYEHRIAICERPIYHIEAFVQHIICQDLLR